MICLLRSCLLFSFNWQENDISNLSLEECRFDVSNVTQENDWISALKALRSDNSNKLILVHININSIRNKFEFLSTQVKSVLIDVLMISKTKFDNSFSVSNCIIDGFSIHTVSVYINVVVASCCTSQKISLRTWKNQKEFLC